MHFKHKYRPESIVEWDKGDMPNCEELAEAIEHFLSSDCDEMPICLPIKTQNNKYAIMIAPQGFTTEVAQVEYDSKRIFFNLK